ncbi:v-type ATPase 116kda subunit family protein, putative [Ichthyophthirius multifiliis]|uniref:V-type proton ATPase subunit a n=1 Tax=Ichthyophthirius multifiliis TaxID=5932 RepID=G0R116_ICHMU|nr:v-type ATPase 116kda subunit family protein, putative [Ichthyophthirius multifiliis]EGR28847.1 v-type ATPase 116kda subunit family protein, putative [Ichthyophthirius multifiliis]|eukprot:XP_004030083.1 v-type ATPase 116kda subunit family protein, putative [Ichthyophthirius multifiliis]
MFGDIGHGFLLFLFGLYLVIFNDSILKDPKSSFRGALQIRYLVLLMGFFAFYCGLIYNDFLSLRLNLFNSCFRNSPNQWGEYEKINKDCTYIFGLDPIWGKAENDLTMANSFKMKLAVILGVSQMMLGITMKAFNSIYFKKWLDFFFEFLPQIGFMGIMFGYMDYLIFAKWNIDHSVVNSGKKIEDQRMPSIITTLIDMALSLGGVKEKNGAIFDKGQGKSAQETFQLIALGNKQTNILLFLLKYQKVVALLCVPLMLFPKPIILNIQNKRKQQQNVSNNNSFENSAQQPLIKDIELVKDLENTQKEKMDNKQHHNEEFSEIFVHQIIETIEFVLGSISNTASYLRLWALSLAHSQLANVFFQKSIQGFLESGNIYALVPAYFVFAIITLGVLMAMDVMECFLHALRLHWVEFQNKFYKADGYIFNPLSFEKQIQFYIENEENY